jgi:ribosomal-protein-alanine N-acetyltransferase
MGETSPLEFRALLPGLKSELVEFFRAFANSEGSHWFHPHPFTPEEADKLCIYDGKDLYYVALGGREVLAYGMLRGWDEGFAIPSLGIAVHPKVRGIGLGRAFMLFLHTAARLYGAKQIRLKVYPENIAAVKLYELLGYRYGEKLEDQLVGYLDL